MHNNALYKKGGVVSGWKAFYVHIGFCLENLNQT